MVTDEEAPEEAAAARAAYGELGSAIYFDLACGTHAVLYELPGRRLNWLWCALPDQAPTRAPAPLRQRG